MASLNIADIPKGCGSNTFKNIFDFCVRNKYGIPIGVYKKIQAHDDENPLAPNMKNEVNDD
jgi:hypothetical protein